MTDARARGRQRLRHWRANVRPPLLERAASAAESLPWSAPLFELLIEELHAEDLLEDALHRPVRDIDPQRYPQAVAVALMLRHSWRADDLAPVLERLGLTDLRD